jgi:hypothetical protein
MLSILKEGEYQSVAVRRLNRKEGIRSFASNLFFKFFAKVSGLKMRPGEMDYRMMNRRMVDAVLEMKEYNRFSKGIFRFVGFDTKWIVQDDIKREMGQTKWNLKSLMKYSLEGITAFSTIPLVFSFLLGILFSFLSFIAILVILIRGLLFGNPVIGLPLCICCIFLVSGIQLFCFGIMGEYISKMYLEIKNRPIYFIKEESEE